MICPSCHHPEGTYTEVEDFNPGFDPEWSYSYYWVCDKCQEYVSSYDERFEYED